jgi:hypothetical protein
MRRAAWCHADQPVSAVLGGAEHRWRPPERTESRAEIARAELWYVAADEGDAPAGEAAKGAVHALPEIAPSLRYSPDAGRQT